MTSAAFEVYQGSRLVGGKAAPTDNSCKWGLGFTPFALKVIDFSVSSTMCFLFVCSLFLAVTSDKERVTTKGSWYF